MAIISNFFDFEVDLLKLFVENVDSCLLEYLVLVDVEHVVDTE